MNIQKYIMRIQLFYVLLVVLVTACSKKIILTTQNGSVKPNNQSNGTTVLKPNNDKNNTPITATVDSSLKVDYKKVVGKAFVVIDGNGNIVTPKTQLPTALQAGLHLQEIARAFTPAQKANLNLRYKTLPPKIIYADEGFVQKSLKGNYIIYKKKFWYWQQKDGLFYLDEVYFK
jgi:hypothetical protein